MVLSIVLITSCISTTSTYHKTLTSHREHYMAKFLETQHSPLKKEDLEKLSFFPIDSAYRFKANVQPVKSPKPVQFATSTGEKRVYYPAYRIVFTYEGEPYDLTAYSSPSLRKMPEYKDYLFVPFFDATNYQSTYGGGRYLELRERNIQDQIIILDFNKAHNPYCAYSDGYSCPIPPLENKLNIPIKAGEKLFKK